MPTYEIEQYELHSVRYRIRAASQAEAIQLVLEGRGEAIEESQELIEVADWYGLAAELNPNLCAELTALGVEGITDVIPSIREIEEVDGELGLVRVELPSQENGLLHSDPVESPLAPKLCVVLESEPHGRECFDHYPHFDAMLAAVRRLVQSSIEHAARDGIERTVGIAIIPSDPVDPDDAPDCHTPG